MIATIQIENKTFKVDFSKPIDLSIPLRAGDNNVNAFYVPPIKFDPFKSGSFICAISFNFAKVLIEAVISFAIEIH